MMHKTICSNCGKECEVPFKPNGTKPVFCRECFQANRTGEAPRRSNFEDRRPQTENRPVEQPQYKEQLEALNSKLDKILNILIVARDTVKEPVAVAPIAVVEPKAEKLSKLSEAKSSTSRTKSSSAGKKVVKKAPKKAI
jgi:CxxC-x17-CxxC domain-containing protein